jgi:GDPmannose 4,6-dehydratase
MQWLMLQQEKPEDYVIATGVQHSVREFVEVAAAKIEMKITWGGEGVDERGYDEKGNCVVAIDPRYFRPAEVETLLGDPTKAREKLGWKPRTNFQELVTEMITSDLEAAQRDVLVHTHGYTVFESHE